MLCSSVRDAETRTPWIKDKMRGDNACNLLCGKSDTERITTCKVTVRGEHRVTRITLAQDGKGHRCIYTLREISCREVGYVFLLECSLDPISLHLS